MGSLCHCDGTMELSAKNETCNVEDPHALEKTWVTEL